MGAPNNHRPVEEKPDAAFTDVDWQRSVGAHEQLIELVRSTPRAQARFESVLADIDRRQATLRKVREAWALTQATIAEMLEMDQSEVSRLERRSDILLSTLRRFVAAAGGELRLIASFPDMDPVEVRLEESIPGQLRPIDEPKLGGSEVPTNRTPPKKGASSERKVPVSAKTPKAAKNTTTGTVKRGSGGKGNLR